jgi:hypothetical protein
MDVLLCEVKKGKVRTCVLTLNEGQMLLSLVENWGNFLIV